MSEKITKKDIIAINQQFDAGTIINNSSLDFALDQANKSKSWLNGCAVLVRAILIDHVFEEANKRTAAGIIVSFFEQNNMIYDPEKVARIIARILMKNITSIKETEDLILDVTIR